MKAGVLTFHNTSNYGAALQAHATIVALEICGLDAEIIDYASKSRRVKYSPWHRLRSDFRGRKLASFIKTIVTTPGVLIRNIAFKNFYKKNLRTSSVRIDSKDNLKNYAKEYDVIIAGSDQIWSPKNNGQDFSYLLDFVGPDVKTFSYASSFGATQISDKLIPRYAELIARIGSISVREDQGRSIVKSLTGRDAIVVVDPVLLLGASYWKQFVKPPGRFTGSYDLYYVNDVGFLKKEIRYGHQIERLPFISLGSFGIEEIFDRNFSIRNGIGPGGFISSISNARCVFTSSYHAVLFCLLFEKPFYAFFSGNEGRDSRLSHVLRLYGLQDRIIYPEDKEIQLNLKIDFTRFETLWPRQNSDSYKFIRESICG